MMLKKLLDNITRLRIRMTALEKRIAKIDGKRPKIELPKWMRYKR